MRYIGVLGAPVDVGPASWLFGQIMLEREEAGLQTRYLAILLSLTSSALNSPIHSSAS